MLSKKLFLKPVLLSACSLLFSLGFIFAQNNPEAKRATHWYFGNGAGLDFSSGSPVAVTNGALHTYEGCATISDTAGNLLFYTDGDTVWDRIHQPMPNGIGLLGCPDFGSSVQAVLIIPQPNSSDIYYVFTTDCGENMGIGGLNYSIIDMSQNSGFGDVISKNNLLYSPSTETLTATLHQNGVDYWIVTHEYGNSVFKSYLLNSLGVNPIPIISSSGIVFSDYYGTLKISPNGKLLAFAFPNLIMQNQLFSFDNTNGQVSYLYSLPQLAGGAYSCSFSPNNSKIYFIDSGYLLYSFDLCSDDSLLIQNSIDTMAVALGNDSYLQCQIGLDYKIYIAADSKYAISSINNPNERLNFNNQNIILGNKTSFYGLPNFADYYFNQKTPCVDTTVPPIDTGAYLPDTLIIPNVFTPNGDGINDVFNITLSGYENVVWKIYNRWGETVKSGKLKVESDGMIELWDGRTNAGVKITDGTYYYMINLTKKGSEHETKKGFVQILN